MSATLQTSVLQSHFTALTNQLGAERKTLQVAQLTTAEDMDASRRKHTNTKPFKSHLVFAND